jgi:hypothetical protein
MRSLQREKERKKKKEGNEEQPTLSARLAERVGHRPIRIPFERLGRFTGRARNKRVARADN